jgi:hypothetical protein
MKLMQLRGTRLRRLGLTFKLRAAVEPLVVQLLCLPSRHVRSRLLD